MSNPLQHRHRTKGHTALRWPADRGLMLLIGLAMLMLAAGRMIGAEVAVAKEHELKAAFLYNFTKFVEWPTNSFADTNTPLVIAVAGPSPCAAALEPLARDRKVNGRSFIIKTVKKPEEAAGAHLLFVPASENARLKDWLAWSAGQSVLTVGESEEFAQQGGMIVFLVEGEKIRFEINMAQADAARLKVSAQLQKLAKTVRRNK
ncbi:MAG TPA: YfiR family protein [Candidatus Limnocylindria bacterium]|nr:YfiR family protein [Candidatus Limnocylindria bacterium]